DTTDVEISLLLDIKIQSEVPHIKSPSMLKVHVFVIYEPSVLMIVQETPSSAPVTTLPPPSVSTIPPAPLQQSTSPIPSPPITTNTPTITTAVLESDALSAVQLRVKKLEKDVLRRHTADLIQKYSMKPAPESSKIQTPTINLEQESKKSALEILKIKKEQTMHENKSLNRNPANHKLYHALMEDLIEDENAMDKGVADTVKDHKIKHDDNDDDDDEDPPAGPNHGKKTKRK
ncbi:hypothetical protein Tco_0067749, partial [Tanacetum coccineum]